MKHFSVRLSPNTSAFLADFSKAANSSAATSELLFLFRGNKISNEAFAEMLRGSPNLYDAGDGGNSRIKGDREGNGLLDLRGIRGLRVRNED